MSFQCFLSVPWVLLPCSWISCPFAPASPCSTTLRDVLEEAHLSRAEYDKMTPAQKRTLRCVASSPLPHPAHSPPPTPR